MLLNDQIIFDFNLKSDISSWYVINDVVMGGMSSSSFKLNEDGFGCFQGRVSLENNGGFSSLRYRFKKRQIDGHTTVVLRLKGDGKKYQFRLKSNARHYHSYITTFKTSGDWQTLEIKLSDLYASFRGRQLDIPNFSANTISEIGFLIGNKKEESFQLLIDKITLK